MRLEGGLGSRTSNGSGDAGAHHESPTAGYELENSLERMNSDQRQPPASNQPRSKLEELRYRLAEQEEQLAWMQEQLEHASRDRHGWARARRLDSRLWSSRRACFIAERCWVLRWCCAR